MSGVLVFIFPFCFLFNKEVIDRFLPDFGFKMSAEMWVIDLLGSINVCILRGRIDISALVIYICRKVGG